MPHVFTEFTEHTEFDMLSRLGTNMRLLKLSEESQPISPMGSAMGTVGFDR